MSKQTNKQTSKQTNKHIKKQTNKQTKIKNKNTGVANYQYFKNGNT